MGFTNSGKEAKGVGGGGGVPPVGPAKYCAAANLRVPVGNLRVTRRVGLKWCGKANLARAQAKECERFGQGEGVPLASCWLKGESGGFAPPLRLPPALAISESVADGLPGAGEKSAAPRAHGGSPNARRRRRRESSGTWAARLLQSRGSRPPPPHTHTPPPLSPSGLAAAHMSEFTDLVSRCKKRRILRPPNGPPREEGSRFPR